MRTAGGFLGLLCRFVFALFLGPEIFLVRQVVYFAVTVRADVALALVAEECVSGPVAGEGLLAEGAANEMLLPYPSRPLGDGGGVMFLQGLLYEGC